MVSAMQVGADMTSQYGIFRLSGLPKDRCIPVSGMVEKPAPGKAPSSFAAVGRYILDPMIFQMLEQTPLGKGGELQLTDAITLSTPATPLIAFQFSGTRHDCGNHEGLLAAAVARQAAVWQETAAQQLLGTLCATPFGPTRAMHRGQHKIARPTKNTGRGYHISHRI